MYLSIFGGGGSESGGGLCGDGGGSSDFGDGEEKIPSGPQPERLTARVGKNLVEYLDRYVEERDYIGNRAHAIRVIVRKRLLELYEEGN